MFTDKDFRLFIREAIADRLERLREEYVHWLNELKKLDEVSAVVVDHPEPPPAEDRVAANVVRMTPRH